MGKPDIILGNDVVRVSGEPSVVDQTVLTVRRVRQTAQDHVPVDREAVDGADLFAVLRYKTDAAADDLARRRVCNVCPGQTDRSGVHMAHARDRFDQLRLAVAVDAGNAVDLALADRQIDIFKTGSQPVSGDAQIMDL